MIQITATDCVWVIACAIIINAICFLKRDSKGFDNEYLMYCAGLTAGCGGAALGMLVALTK